MTHFETTFGDLRSLAQRPADAQTWRLFMGALMRIRGEDEALSEYARGMARSWSDAQRIAPAHVVRALGQGRASRWLYLMRALTLEPSSASWLGRPELSGITHLTYDAGGGEAEDAVRRALGGSFMRGLRSLSIERASDGLRVAHALAEVETNTRLERLSIRPACLGFIGAKVLAESDVFARLEALALEDARCGVAGARLLFESASASLTEVKLRGEAGFTLGDAGARALVEVCPETLTSLEFSHQRVGDAGARAFASGRLIRTLKVLDLSHNVIGGEGARVLARALQGDQRLDLRGNRVGVSGV